MKIAIKQLVSVASLLSALVPWCYAYTNTTLAKFKVSATVTNGCIFNNGTKPISVPLPDLLPVGEGVSKIVSFQLTCTPGIPAEISIDDGKHADKSGDRNLALDGQPDVLIPYQIYYYVNSAQKTLWNNPITFNSNELAKAIDMMVEVPQPKTLLHPGQYTDTDIITVSY